MLARGQFLSMNVFAKLFLETTGLGIIHGGRGGGATTTNTTNTKTTMQQLDQYPLQRLCLIIPIMYRTQRLCGDHLDPSRAAKL
jgi:hypothetical protein